MLRKAVLSSILLCIVCLHHIRDLLNFESVHHFILVVVALMTVHLIVRVVRVPPAAAASRDPDVVLPA